MLLQTATLAGGISTNAGLECRAPCAYERMPSADDDDDDAAAAAAAGGMAMAVSGATNATAEALAAARAEAAARADAGGQQQRQRGDDGEQERRLVEHLPPANGTEDVYTLLKLYSISKYLVGGQAAELRCLTDSALEFSCQGALLAVPQADASKAVQQVPDPRTPAPCAVIGMDHTPAVGGCARMPLHPVCVLCLVGRCGLCCGASVRTRWSSPSGCQSRSCPSLSASPAHLPACCCWDAAAPARQR